jgi:hypothetical protein
MEIEDIKKYKYTEKKIKKICNFYKNQNELIDILTKPLENNNNNNSELFKV